MRECLYVYDPDTVAFYLLSEEHTRHGQMTGQRAKVAGTVNGQPKTVALIRGVQFKGEIRRLSGDEEARMRQRYVKRFPVARMLSAPVWEIRPDEIKFTDNTLGFGKNYTGGVMPAPSRRSASRLKAGRSSGVLLVTSCSLSTTTSGRKTRPGVFTSTTIGFTAVSLRPRITSALISSCGPWQMANTGLPPLTKSRVKVTKRSSPRSWSGE